MQSARRDRDHDVAVLHALGAEHGIRFDHPHGRAGQVVIVGFLAVVSPEKAADAASALAQDGIAAWPVGVVRSGARPPGDFEQGAKGVDGGAVRLVGTYSDGSAVNGAK